MHQIYDWLFKTEDGKYQFAQKPNWPIIVSFIFYALNWWLERSYLVLMARAFLIYWAILELFYGINNARRIMGLIVLIIVSAGIFLA